MGCAALVGELAGAVFLGDAGGSTPGIQCVQKSTRYEADKGWEGRRAGFASGGIDTRSFRLFLGEQLFASLYHVWAVSLVLFLGSGWDLALLWCLSWLVLDLRDSEWKGWPGTLAQNQSTRPG